jgi:hypothetical protein
MPAAELVQRHIEVVYLGLDLDLGERHGCLALFGTGAKSRPT